MALKIGDEKNILIICFGNPLRQDDGIGWQAANYLTDWFRNNPVTVIFRQQLTQDLVLTIQNASQVFFIDSEIGLTPGKITVRNLKAAQFSSSGLMHHMTPAELLAWTKLLCNRMPPAKLITITGTAFDFEESLSPPVEKSLPSLFETVKALVCRTGASR